MGIFIEKTTVEFHRNDSTVASGIFRAQTQEFKHKQNSFFSCVSSCCILALFFSIPNWPWKYILSQLPVIVKNNPIDPNLNHIHHGKRGWNTTMAPPYPWELLWSEMQVPVTKWQLLLYWSPLQYQFAFLKHYTML